MRASQQRLPMAVVAQSKQISASSRCSLLGRQVGRLGYSVRRRRLAARLVGHNHTTHIDKPPPSADCSENTNSQWPVAILLMDSAHSWGRSCKISCTIRCASWSARWASLAVLTSTRTASLAFHSFPVLVEEVVEAVATGSPRATASSPALASSSACLQPLRPRRHCPSTLRTSTSNSNSSNSITKQPRWAPLLHSLASAVAEAEAAAAAASARPRFVWSGFPTVLSSAPRQPTRTASSARSVRSLIPAAMSCSHQQARYQGHLARCLLETCPEQARPATVACGPGSNLLAAKSDSLPCAVSSPSLTPSCPAGSVTALA
eukprot:m.43379 g.43379  ORF g.43379 m.43379 type:complete len:319 (+) comp6153_c1_seq1:153-1109(+)